MKSVIHSQATEDKLKEDGFGSESLTVSTLDSMLGQGVIKPTFKTYDGVMDQADYTINKSLANNSADNDLSATQKEIGDGSK